MKTSKRIGFLLSIITERGGIGRVTSLISNELNKIEGFEIHIISYVKKESNAYNWSGELNYHYLLENQIPMKKGIFTATSNLRKIVKSSKLDILIACGAIVGPLGVLGTCFTKAKLIYWSHSSFKGTSKKQFRMFNEHFTAAFAKSIVSLTKVDQVNYKKLTLAREVHQIYNPVDERLKDMQKPYNKTSRKIISVGRLTYQKNFECLIDVAALVIEKNKDIVWDIYGSGENEINLRKKIEDKGLSNNVILKGQSNNLYDLYNDYAIMVMTSRYEGFPMSLIEGLANNLPLISFDIPTGPNEIIREGKNGYLIGPSQINEMADKIITLMNDTKLRLLFSEKNRDYFSNYDLDGIIKKWSSVLEKI